MKIYQIFFFLLSFFSTFVQAETIQLTAKADFQPEKIIGLVFNQLGTSYFHDTKLVNKQSLDKQVIEFELPENLPEKTFASALLISKDGEIVFASIRPVDKAKIDYLSLSKCEDSVSLSEDSQKSVLNELVEVRKQRLAAIQEEVDALLTSALKRQILALEAKQGFQVEKQISADMPASKLNIRLYKLVQSLEN